MTDLTNKTALITGSARGIGKAIALRYAARGANIIVNYSGDEVNAAKTVQELEALGAQTLSVKADMSKVEEIERLFQESLARFGRIDIVVANAGVEVIEQRVLDATEEDFDRLFAINTKGTFFSLQKAAQYIADNGRIIYVGSSTTNGALPGVGLYGSSKSAARYLVGVLALELADRGVTVNTILPTTIDGAGVFTSLAGDDPIRQQIETLRMGVRMGRPEDVADAAEYFAGELASFVNGQQLLVTGGPAF